MKGVLWCAKFPTVSIPQSLVPRHVTLIYPYYDNQQFFRTQVLGWMTWPASLREYVSLILVDDGSPEPATLPRFQTFKMRLFRIHEDRRWNWLAARNIGAFHADEGWILLTDMDHVVPVETMEALVYGVHDPRVVYAFSRIEHTGKRITPHSASFLMTREMFWRIGGYDERMSGYYGSDGYYRRRLAATAPIQILTDTLVRHEFVGDSSTTRYKRKQAEDGKLKALVASFPKGSKPVTLSFPYHEVTC